MANGENQWTGLVQAARLTAGKAEGGDPSAARDVLTHCVVALGDLLRHGQPPDPERSVHLGFLLQALRRVVQRGVGVDKVLGVHVRNRPRVGSL